MSILIMLLADKSTVENRPLRGGSVAVASVVVLEPSINAGAELVEVVRGRSVIAPLYVGYGQVGVFRDALGP